MVLAPPRKRLLSAVVRLARPVPVRMVVLVLGVLVLGCAEEAMEEQHLRGPVLGSDPTLGLDTLDVPDTLAVGARLFDARCSACHGVVARGTEVGPPLVHTIYAPAHHADFSFYRAIEFGVRAHHWTYGDMEPMEGVSRPDVDAIVSYVRWLQRAAGIE